MADGADSKSVGSNTVWVRVPHPAPIIKTIQSYTLKSLAFISSDFLYLSKNTPTVPQPQKTKIKIVYMYIKNGEFLTTINQHYIC